MGPLTLLHTAARRYCLGVAELVQLLHEIERAVPEDFATEVEVRDFLRGAAERLADEVPIFSVRGDGARKVEEIQVTYRPLAPAQEVERQRFLDHFRHLSPADLLATEPLPFRQVLGSNESRRIRAVLRARWGVDDREHLWHPLWTTPVPPAVLAVRAGAFDAIDGAALLREILAARGVARVWQLGEHGWQDEYALDLSLCSFAGMGEAYWTSGGFDWLVYRSHEATLAIAGDALIAAVKQAWPAWAEHRWA
jgi:hypothetical protein